MASRADRWQEAEAQSIRLYPDKYFDTEGTIRGYVLSGPRLRIESGNTSAQGALALAYWIIDTFEEQLPR